MTKKIISVIMAAAMLLSLFAMTGCGEKTAGKGTEENPWLCGATEEDTVRAYITDGSLWISGRGRMADYESLEDRPWNKKLSKIESVNVFGDIDYIGKNAFNGLGRDTDGCDVGIYGVVVEIGEKAFANMNVDFICVLTLPESLERIGSRAFAGSSFTDIYFNGVPEIASNAFSGDFITAYTINGSGWNDENMLPYGGEIEYKNMFVFNYEEDYGTEDLTGKGSFYVPEDEPCSYNAESIDEGYHFVRYEVLEGSIDTDLNNPEIETLLTENVSLKVIFEKNAEE